MTHNGCVEHADQVLILITKTCYENVIEVYIAIVI